jgi:hypothetical protein
MKLQIIESKNSSPLENHSLLIDGVQDESTQIMTDVNTYQLHTSNLKLIENLRTWSIERLKESQISMIRYDLNENEYFEQVIYLFISGKKDWTIELGLYPKMRNWDKFYNLRDYVHEIENLCHGDIQLDGVDELEEGYGIRLIIDDQLVTFGSYLDTLLTAFAKIEKEAEIKMYEKLNKSTFISFFKFPTEYEVACKQYLIYFIEFLRDLGVEATSKLSTEQAKTVFMVKPIDKHLALETIKDLLSLYLGLPSINNIQTVDIVTQEVTIQKLISNIQFLHSQITLNNALIQTKNATIEALELSNYQLKSILNNNENRNSDSEDIIGGIVSVEKFKKNGITIDLAEILRRIKQKLK